MRAEESGDALGMANSYFDSAICSVVFGDFGKVQKTKRKSGFFRQYGSETFNSMVGIMKTFIHDVLSTIVRVALD